MTESKMYEALVRIKDNLPVTFHRIEPGNVTKSIPDVYYYTPNITGWIELKIIKYKPTKRMFEIPYRPGQIGFLQKHFRTNKHTYCLGWFDHTYYLFNSFIRDVENIKELSIWHGKSLKDINLANILYLEGVVK